MRRHGKGRMDGERFLADQAKAVVHDLDGETSWCEIDDVVAAGNELAFETLDAAKVLGFTPCDYCVAPWRR
jgi:hypothetical protein